MDTFSVNLPSGKLLKGSSFVKEGGTRNLVVMTGMDEHSERYARLGEYLNGLGFDVYVLDAFGQGLNAESVDLQERWHVGAFDENVQAANIKIEELKKNGKPTALMGHSMGSFMVQRYLELYPNTADSIILCGSNGPAKGKMASSYALAKLLIHKNNWNKPSKLFQSAGLGAYMKSVENRKRDNDWLSYNEENVIKYDADPYCGHVNTCGFWKEFLKGMDQLYRKKNLDHISKKERILIIAGEDDPVGEKSKGVERLHQMYLSLGVEDTKIIIYKKMRHEILNEKDNEMVYTDISNFLLHK